MVKLIALYIVSFNVAEPNNNVKNKRISIISSASKAQTFCTDPSHQTTNIVIRVPCTRWVGSRHSLRSNSTPSVRKDLSGQSGGQPATY